MINQYALWIGRGVMVGAGGLVALAFLLAAWWLTGLLGADVFKRLRRIYSLQVIGYWLDRLEKQGQRIFREAEMQDALAKEAIAARGDSGAPPMRDTLETDAEFEAREKAWQKANAPS